ncbi:cholecystokinin receptor-like [Pollicipes pollicipes]|uniref:cholecystokinin receptor-like n=1 Tax=Pollicipes pollicipes TaxID=41117 RepID=UPI0018850BD1|nr:cholecystokinin receptor-like [Pollicipes pollicipes]
MANGSSSLAPGSLGNVSSAAGGGRPYEYPELADIWAEWGLLICLYSVILFLSVLGNVLVIVTLIQNTKMRTVTNVYLLNLSISDLLLGVLCVPFTLVGTLLKNFIFGGFMCKILPYLQAVSVSVSAWTLVAMSVERYYAICHPLRSRAWQTRSHALRLIGAVWTAGLLAAAPTLVVIHLIPMDHPGQFKCREQWPTLDLEKGYMIFIDLTYLVIPIVAMFVTFVSITRTLRRVMEDEQAGQQLIDPPPSALNGSTSKATLGQSRKKPSPAPPSLRLRHSNAERSLASKRRVIKMLFVVVLEFFVCWTPIYVLNTLSLFNQEAVYRALGSAGISFFHLLSYTSSCCNPITYCFMNVGFRQAFLAAFGCRKAPSRHDPNRATTHVALRSLSCNTGGSDLAPAAARI